MPLLTPIEAAMKLGIGYELLKYFQAKCPKKGETRVLQVKEIDGQTYVDEKELEAFRAYLNAPWPHEKGKRPAIPEAIKEDIRKESHYECAICGNANNGEIAHIEAVADTLNNGPDDLLYLCPNHHTQYDLGYKPTNNITTETVKAAKLMKRAARVRSQRFEANTTKLLHAVTNALKILKEKLSGATDPELVSVYETETRQLMESLPDLLNECDDAAHKDSESDSVEKLTQKIAPSIVKHTRGVSKQTKPMQLRMAADSLISSIDEALLELDEADCPHCGGSGLTGLVGDFCAFCKGDMVVTKEEAKAYDPAEIDEVACPRCHGGGTTGLAGDICAYCKGSCVVTEEMAEEYDPNEIDEVNCPRCNGTGTTGLAGDFCIYCKGSCFVSSEKASEYDPEELDETDCPHCNGRGTTGLAGDFCSYCKGSCTVSRDKASEYDPADLDETDCPHCAGRGTTGFNQVFCSYCKGSCVVSQEEADDYDPEEIDEVRCPHCCGSGTQGFNMRACSLCNGDCTVSRDVDAAYAKKYGRRDCD
jgi:hypothetical protein